MPQTKAPPYQRVIEDILRAMGRSDVGVDYVSIADEGVLSAAFVRGLRVRRIALPLERVMDRAQVRAALEEALADLTPRGPDLQPASAATPEARFQEKDRQHRGGARFD
jgi:hypothetical protein